MEIQKEISTAIQQFYEETGLEQKNLVLRSELSKEVIKKMEYEVGLPTVLSLIKLANGLGKELHLEFRDRKCESRHNCRKQGEIPLKI